MKFTLRLFAIMILLVLLNCRAAAGEQDTSKISDIRVQNLKMRLAPDSRIFTEALLTGEIRDTDVEHVILSGPFSRSESISKMNDIIFIFIKGRGTLRAGKKDYSIEPESIAFAPSLKRVTVLAAKGDTVHYLKITKKLSNQDLTDIKSFPAGNRQAVYFTTFNECKAYTEKIKSPNTVSRTVLPKDFIPRAAMGTVETIGPDAVGAHRHPMLDQLFLGLSGNDVIVHADDKTVHFPQFSLLHIPIGSNHWVTVEKGKRMYYQWMDFFLTKEGEEWLKTHKPLEEKKTD
ncbi:MAG: hypothetical protein WC061_09965 [Melioribacteraceae bacterium]